MAILNVKNFPDEVYERLRTLARAERRSIAAEVIHLLDRATTQPKVHSILELRGLGKELWKDVSAAEHVRRERESWD